MVKGKLDAHRREKEIERQEFSEAERESSEILLAPLDPSSRAEWFEELGFLLGVE